MRALFSVYGYGLGHATRCEAIIKKLGNETRITASDNAYDYFKDKKMQPTRINSFKIGNITKSFSWFQTLFENVDAPFNLINDYNVIKEVTKEFKPDIIISDTEPVSILYSNTAGIKNAFLSNILPITHEYNKIPANLKNPKLDSQEAVIRMVIEFMHKKTDIILSPTIKRYEENSKIKFTDLIVRKKPHELKTIEEIRQEYNLPENYTIVSFGGAAITSEYYKTIIPILKEFNNENFIISTNGAIKTETTIKNCRLYPFIKDYLSMLKASKSVISLAGHSTISESLVYQKPNYVIPINDHVEQLINAVLINKQEYGKAYLHPGELEPKKLKNEISEFLQNTERYKENIQNAGFKGNGDAENAEIITKTASQANKRKI